MLCIRCRRRRRHYLLLEVIVAIMLVLLCLFPMLKPHVFFLGQEKQWIRDVDTDRLADIVIAEVVMQLYRNEIPWETLQEGQEVLDSRTMSSDGKAAMIQLGRYGLSERVSFAFKHHDKVDDATLMVSNTVEIALWLSRPKAHDKVYRRTFFVQRQEVAG